MTQQNTAKKHPALFVPFSQSALASNDASAKLAEAIGKKSKALATWFQAQCNKALIAAYQGNGEVEGSAALVMALLNSKTRFAPVVKSYLCRGGITIEDNKVVGMNKKRETLAGYKQFLASLEFEVTKTASAPKKHEEYKDGTPELLKFLKSRLSNDLKELKKHNEGKAYAFFEHLEANIEQMIADFGNNAQ